MTEQELLNQNNDTFRDENSDAWKLKGKTRTVEARGFFANIIASVFLTLGKKADLVNGKVPAEQLPEMGGSNGGATEEEASSLLGFSNPLGHIRKDPLFGPQSFARENDTLGSTVVQRYDADGVSAITFDFAYDPLGVSSGSVLEVGVYWLFFVNLGGLVLVRAEKKTGEGSLPEEPAPNQGPTANAGADQTVTEGAVVVLSGSGSDPDGTIASYGWSQVSGTAVTLANPNTATATTPALTAGTYVFRLTVTDEKGAMASDDVTITVNAAGNITPPAPTNGIVDDTANTFTFTIPEQA